MPKTRIVFCGTPKISAGILKTILLIPNIQVVAVITQPDRPVGRKKTIEPSPVKKIALENNIMIFQPDKIGTITFELELIKPDFMLTCAYGQFVPDKILNIFQNCINIHASLLPKYRGGSPIQYAILNGETTTGISLMKMVKAMDAGEVYVSESLDIAETDNSEDLFIKMEELAIKMVRMYLSDIFMGKILGMAQDESKVSFAYNITGDGEKIDWNWPAHKIHNFVRALTPQPVPFCFYNDERWKIGKTSLVNQQMFELIDLNKFENGQIISGNNDGIIVKTGDETVLNLVLIQRAGKLMSPAISYLKQGSIALSGLFK